MAGDVPALRWESHEELYNNYYVYASSTFCSSCVQIYWVSIEPVTFQLRVWYCTKKTMICPPVLRDRYSLYVRLVSQVTVASISYSLQVINLVLTAKQNGMRQNSRCIRIVLFPRNTYRPLLHCPSGSAQQLSCIFWSPLRSVKKSLSVFGSVYVCLSALRTTFSSLDRIRRLLGWC